MSYQDSLRAAQLRKQQQQQQQQEVGQRPQPRAPTPPAPAAAPRAAVASASASEQVALPMATSGEVQRRQQIPWTPRDEPQTARERAQFKNKVPFDEDIYEVMKATLKLFTKRIGNSERMPQKLSVEEAQWLQSAVEMIIEDARMYGPPEKPISPPPPPMDHQ